MPIKFCPNCRATNLATDFTSGRTECQECGYIAEDNLLVSEVGFAEAAGGRVHVQGAFVSNHATGIGGLRGRNSLQSVENIKTNGQMRITHVAGHMGLNHTVRQGAVRLFALAVDANFHKGRRKDYVVASCLYLQSRMKKEPHMLIDFSERLRINVFELGGTYLKLRSTLHLPDPMPLTDPAIYSLRFANRLELGQDKHKVATDASRLVRRFQADWMSEGRRPAGVCGACLLVAARMNGYHRTPEEIAQIVKVSPQTVRRRLLEFARTDMANKTVEEWKTMSDADIVAPGEKLPPVVKNEHRRIAKRKRLDASGRSESVQTENPEEEAGQSDDDEDRQARVDAKRMQMEGAIQAAAAHLGELGDDEDEDGDLAPPQPDQYVKELDAAGDDPEAAQNERARAARKFKRINKVASLADGVGDEDEELEDLQEEVEEFEQGEEDREVGDEEDEGDEEGGDKEDDGADKEEGAPSKRPDDAKFKLVKFDKWDDPVAVRKHVEEKYMPRIRIESALTDRHVEDRLSLWMGVRDPREIMYEMEVVARALRARERQAKADGESEFEDVDDEEIDAIWQMSEEERKARARMWLSHNGRWLEEDKEKQAKRADYERDNADKISRKKSRKKAKPAKRTEPFRTPQEAIEGFMTQKNFSSRINMAAFKEMGFDMAEGMHDGLEQMDDDKSDDEKEDDNEKHDAFGADFPVGDYDGDD